jgi:hypothetical protein
MKLQRWLHTIPLWLRSIFRKADADRDLDDELQYHLDRKAAHEGAARRITWN